MTVLALTGLATAAAVLIPALPAAAASVAGAAPAWLIWTAASLLSLAGGLWFSTWGQAAALRAAACDARPGEAMGWGWGRTAGFAWVLSLALLAVGGGLVLLIVPGLWLGAAFFFAPYYQLEDEASGLAALELSFARVRPVFGAVAWRLVLLGLIVWLPSRIPYLGWLLAPLWAPFGLVASARLAADLRTLAPAPERPGLLAPVAALSLLFVSAGGFASWTAARAGLRLYDSYASGRLSLPAPDAATAQSVLAVLQGQGTEEDSRRSLNFVLELSSAAAVAP